MHDVYVQTGYIEPTPSGLRITPKGQVMLFRFGKAEDIRYGTLRKEIESFLS